MLLRSATGRGKSEEVLGSNGGEVYFSWERVYFSWAKSTSTIRGGYNSAVLAAGQMEPKPTWIIFITCNGEHLGA